MWEVTLWKRQEEMERERKGDSRGAHKEMSLALELGHLTVWGVLRLPFGIKPMMDAGEPHCPWPVTFSSFLLELSPASPQHSRGGHVQGCLWVLR